MASPRLLSIGGATVRASPDFELVPPPASGAARAGASADRAFVAVLRPVSKRWLGVHAVDAVAATLFRACRRPGVISRAMAKAMGPERNRTLAALVLDGILELEGEHGFVSGADAHSMVFRESVSLLPVASATARLSLAAMRYADALPIDDARSLAERMYLFHRLPATIGWRQRLPDARATELFLRIERGTSMRQILDRHWKQQAAVSTMDDWSAWSPRERRPARGGSPNTFKVFVSPDPEHAPDAIHAVVGALADNRPAPFKFGGGVYSLLRPDKIVVYFTTRSELRDFVSALLPRLDALRAHGVPFSADLTTDALVSWGVDPAHTSLPWSRDLSESWRVTVVSRLARALIGARHARTAGPDRIRFALDRLSLDGIDVTTWTPSRQ
ncbi:MAG: hypothetical protein ABMA00_03310 [Gemmatimonas sp.]